MIPADQLLSASKNPTLVSNIVQAPTVLQETFVQQVQFAYYFQKNLITYAYVY